MLSRTGYKSNEFPVDPIPEEKGPKLHANEIPEPQVPSRAQEAYQMPGVPQNASRAIFNVQAPPMPILAVAADWPNWAVKAQHWLTTVGMTDCTICVDQTLISTFKSTGFVPTTSALTINDVVRACILSTCGTNSRDLPSILWKAIEIKDITFLPFRSALDIEARDMFFNRVIETLSVLRMKFTIIAEVFPPDTAERSSEIKESIEKQLIQGIWNKAGREISDFMNFLKLEIIIEQDRDKSISQSPATFDELIKILSFAQTVARDKYSYPKGQSNTNNVEKTHGSRFERNSIRVSRGMQNQSSARFSQSSGRHRSYLEATSGARDNPPTQPTLRQKSNQTSFKGKLAERGCFICGVDDQLVGDGHLCSNKYRNISENNV